VGDGFDGLPVKAGSGKKEELAAGEHR
jgi:hypothetical protein